MATATLAAANPFKKATRAKSRLRMALCGPAGSGKSYTALRFAFALKKLLEESEQRPISVAAIDTENGSISKYVGESEDDLKWEFDVVDLQDHSPSSYTQLIKLAGGAGYDILIVDSLSHAWTGTGGALDQVDRKKAAGKNAFTDGWREVTPLHNAMIDAIVGASCHVIATMRTKTEWVMETDARGKVVPRKIGLAPIQRAGMEYEFDIVCDIDQETHTLTVTKSRCKAIDNAIITKPGFTFFVPVFSWLESGSDIPREVIDAAAFKTKEPPMSPLERAKKQKEEADKKKVAPKGKSESTATEPTAPPEETPAATEATASASDGITDATRAEIRSLVVEIWPTREDAIRESTAIVARFNASSVAELSEIDGRKIVAELLNTKSEVMRKRAADKLAASGTTPTVSVEPDKRQRDAAEAEAAKAAEATGPAAESLTAPGNATPDAEAAHDAADLSDEPGTANKQQLARCEELANALNWPHEKQLEYLAKAECKTFRNLSEAQMADLIGKLEARLAAKPKQ